MQVRYQLRHSPGIANIAEVRINTNSAEWHFLPEPGWF